MKTKKSTMVELVEELEKLVPRSAAIEDMIKEAKAGEFHDYKNEKYACGKVEAYNRLMFIGHKDLANRIANGEFDEEPDEADLKQLREIAPPEMHKALGL